MPAHYVKPVVRVLSLALAAFAVFFVLGLLGINLYVQSPGAQQKICDALSQSLGLPVSVFRIWYSPWSGLVLDDLLVHDPGGSGPLIRANRITARCDYLKIFRHRLVIKQALFQRVDVSLPAAPWVTESHAPKPSVPQAAAVPEASSPSPTANPSAAAAASSATAGPPLQKNPSRSFLVEVQRFKLTGGTVNLVSQDGSPVANVRDLEVSARLKNGVYSGRMQATAASLTNRLTVEDLSSPLRASSTHVELTALQAKICGGQLTGSFEVETNVPPYHYELKLAVAGVNVNDMGTRVDSVLEGAHGILQARLDLHGTATDVALNSGEGQLQVVSGYIDQYPLLKEIGRWTQIDELQRLQLDEARSHFWVAGTDVNVDDLRLLSKNCEVKLWGQIQSAQKLNLNGRLTINQFLSQKIPNELEENFVTNTDDHSRSLDFSVTGMVSRPETNLFDRIIGDKRKFFRKFLGGERRERPRESLPKATASETAKE